MMAESLPTSELLASVRMTPKADTEGVRIRFKVFWKTTRFWTEADVTDFQTTAPSIAERLRTERYWNKDGELRRNQFTCEDFAIRVLCEYAAPRGLPVKLTTGVRSYRNMDMQRTGVNTIAVATPEELLPGDILAQVHDLKGKYTSGRAHHIQVAVARTAQAIVIYQGNSTDAIHFYITDVTQREDEKALKCGV